MDKSLREDPMATFCALAKGRGTRLEALPPLDSMILISKPPLSVSTKEVYQGLALDKIVERPKTGEIIEALREANRISPDFAMGRMANVLESYTIKKYDLVCQTKERMKKACENSFFMMSGSGPTVFGIVPSKSELKVGYYRLKEVNRETYMTRTMV